MVSETRRFSRSSSEGRVFLAFSSQSGGIGWPCGHLVPLLALSRAGADNERSELSVLESEEEEEEEEDGAGRDAPASSR